MQILSETTVKEGQSSRMRSQALPYYRFQETFQTVFKISRSYSLYFLSYTPATPLYSTLLRITLEC